MGWDRGLSGLLLHEENIGFLERRILRISEQRRAARASTAPFAPLDRDTLDAVFPDIAQRTIDYVDMPCNEPVTFHKYGDVPSVYSDGRVIKGSRFVAAIKDGLAFLGMSGGVGFFPQYIDWSREIIFPTSVTEYEVHGEGAHEFSHHLQRSVPLFRDEALAEGHARGVHYAIAAQVAHEKGDPAYMREVLDWTAEELRRSYEHVVAHTGRVPEPAVAEAVRSFPLSKLEGEMHYLVGTSLFAVGEERLISAGRDPQEIYRDAMRGELRFLN